MSTLEWTGRSDDLSPQASERRLRELVLYVAMRSEGDASFAMTKLNKLVYFADFGAFFRWGESITGQEYKKREQGPCPTRMLPVLNDLQEEGALFVRPTKHYTYVQKVPLAARPPKVDLFSSAEIALVDEIIESWWGRSAADISQASHDHVWHTAKMNERIPYSAVLFTNKRPLTAEIAKYGRSLDDEAQRALSRRGGRA